MASLSAEEVAPLQLLLKVICRDDTLTHDILNTRYFLETNTLLLTTGSVKGHCGERV